MYTGQEPPIQTGIIPPPISRLRLFRINPLLFVQNDSVTFDDNATQTTVQLSDLLITKGVSINNTAKSYTFAGTGGIAGTGILTKTGKGLLDMGNIQSAYTGKTIYTNALVKVSALNQSSIPGPRGRLQSYPLTGRDKYAVNCRCRKFQYRPRNDHSGTGHHRDTEIKRSGVHHWYHHRNRWIG